MKWFGKNGGNIINITASLQNLGTLYQAHASAAKAAVDALTRTLALEWGPKGVRVNGVAPGFIEGTEGFERLSGENYNKLTEEQKKQFQAKISDNFPLQRLGNRNDVSNAVLFLACEGSSYITGQTILVDGGQLAVKPNYILDDPIYKKKWIAKF